MTHNHTPHVQARPDDRFLCTIEAGTVTATRINRTGRTVWEVRFTDDMHGLRVAIDPEHVRAVYEQAAPLVAALDDAQPATVAEVLPILSRLGFTDTPQQPQHRG